MYVTIDSVMLQVQRYLHVNRQKGNICQKNGRSLLKERATVMQHIEKKMYRCFWTDPPKGDHG